MVRAFLVKNEIRILYVEDIPADAAMVNHALRQGGLTFRTKRWIPRALFKRARTRPADVILSTTAAFIRRLTALAIAKDKCPDTPFIFVTNSLGEEVAIETFESGATDYVLKK